MLKFDEMYTQLPYEFFTQGKQIRDHYKIYDEWLARQPGDMMAKRREEAEMIFRRVGITFAVYGEKDEEGVGNERLIPFDLIPRIIPAHEWASMELGLVQRVTALNRFIHDVYHDQEILKAGVMPREQIENNAQFRPEMMGVDVPNNIYSHISGVDIVRAPNSAGEGEYYVLEDNLRVPSGVSYMLEDRKMMMRLFPELFNAHRVAPIAHYPDLLLETLRDSSPATTAEPTVVVLTPGMHNSAYFEHAFLAQQMGIELVEGQDLFVKDNFLYMRTTRGPKRVDVIYRRVDDDFLDPKVFRPTSTLGCEGLLDVYRAGHVSICNAVGTGVADDKSIYPYVPQDDRVLPRRKTHSEQRAHVHVPQQGRPGLHPGQLERPGGQRGAWRWRLRHAGGPGVHQSRNRRLPPSYFGQPQWLHCAAHTEFVELPDVCRERYCAAPH
jgi:uncharacterized circularly permuted ATP-grasp superfamily protein